MTFKAEAIYENGVLKLAVPLPLLEHQRVDFAAEYGVANLDRPPVGPFSIYALPFLTPVCI
jgi:hypothetical protein